MSTHSGERHFSCDQCNYSCIQANDIKKHILQHSGENPFACNQCSFSCRRTSRLKYHMLSHAGEKPFACKKCKNSCRQSHDLKTHMKTHFYFIMLIKGIKDHLDKLRDRFSVKNGILIYYVYNRLPVLS